MIFTARFKVDVNFARRVDFVVVKFCATAQCDDVNRNNVRAEIRRQFVALNNPVTVKNFFASARR